MENNDNVEPKTQPEESQPKVEKEPVKEVPKTTSESKKSNGALKIILIIVVVLLLLCICISAVCVITGTFSTNKFFNSTVNFETTDNVEPNSNDNSGIIQDNTDSGLLETTPYVDDVNGFSINAPKNWKATDGSDYESFVIFKDNKANLDFTPNINVVSEDNQGYALNAYVDASLEALASLENYVALDRKEVTINGKDAVIITGSFTQSGYDTQNMQLILIKDEKAYITTASVLKQDWNGNYEKLFEASFNTFK